MQFTRATLIDCARTSSRALRLSNRRSGYFQNRSAHYTSRATNNPIDAIDVNFAGALQIYRAARCCQARYQRREAVPAAAAAYRFARRHRARRNIISPTCILIITHHYTIIIAAAYYISTFPPCIRSAVHRVSRPFIIINPILIVANAITKRSRDKSNFILRLYALHF